MITLEALPVFNLFVVCCLLIITLISKVKVDHALEKMSAVSHSIDKVEQKLDATHRQFSIRMDQLIAVSIAAARLEGRRDLLGEQAKQAEMDQLEKNLGS